MSNLCPFPVAWLVGWYRASHCWSHQSFRCLWCLRTDYTPRTSHATAVYISVVGRRCLCIELDQGNVQYHHNRALLFRRQVSALKADMLPSVSTSWTQRLSLCSFTVDIYFAWTGVLVLTWILLHDRNNSMLHLKTIFMFIRNMQQTLTLYSAWWAFFSFLWCILLLLGVLNAVVLCRIFASLLFMLCFCWRVVALSLCSIRYSVSGPEQTDSYLQLLPPRRCFLCN